MGAAEQERQWSEHIARWQSGKLSRVEYCRQHNLKFHTFVYRLKRHRQTLVRPITLVPVTVHTPSAAREMVLRGPKGWSLALAGDVSTQWLAELMGQLA